MATAQTINQYRIRYRLKGTTEADAKTFNLKAPNKEAATFRAWHHFESIGRKHSIIILNIRKMPKTK